MKATTSLELDHLVNRWAEGSAAIDSETLAAFATKLAAIFGVKRDEVAVLALVSKGKHLKFLLPEILQAVGTIPVNSTSALAARTARERKPEFLNAFAGARHATVFEGVPMGRRADEPIQKIMSAPILSGKEVLGVVQISRKGRSQAESGPDFNLGNLRTLQEVTPALARFVQISQKE